MTTELDRKQIESKSERELDALIAEMMGWTSKRHPMSEFGEPSFTEWWNPHGQRAILSAFSTYMGETWEVVEWMKERGYNLDLRCYTYNRTYALFYDGPLEQLEDAPYSEGNGEHATPLAICKASLLAVMEAK